MHAPTWFHLEKPCPRKKVSLQFFASKSGPALVFFPILYENLTSNLFLLVSHDMYRRTTNILSNGEFETTHTISELYPSCVDVVNVWPPPNSILKPLQEYSSYAVYVIKVTFSRQIKLANLNRTYISFSISTINPLNFSPYYTKYSYGSGRSLWTYFKVLNFMKYVR